jgi:hypothetical protein
MLAEGTVQMISCASLQDNKSLQVRGVMVSLKLLRCQVERYGSPLGRFEGPWTKSKRRQ